MNGWAIFVVFPSAVRRGIFVESQSKIISSLVGAAYCIHIPDDVAPDGALSIGGWRGYKYASPDGLGKICVPSVFHLWLKMQPPFASFVHPKLPLAARLGLCRGARSSRLPFSASRRFP
jgi:hypothetical protein